MRASPGQREGVRTSEDSILTHRRATDASSGSGAPTLANERVNSFSPGPSIRREPLLPDVGKIAPCHGKFSEPNVCLSSGQILKRGERLLRVRSQPELASWDLVLACRSRVRRKRRIE